MFKILIPFNNRYKLIVNNTYGISTQIFINYFIFNSFAGELRQENIKNRIKLNRFSNIKN